MEEKNEALAVIKPDAQQLTIKHEILKDQLNEEAKNETEKLRNRKDIE